MGQQVKSSYAIQNDDNSITFQDYLANAAEGRNYGLELESSWDLSDRLNWAFSYGWLQTEFVDYHYDTSDGEFNKDGRAQSHAPEYSLATAVSYDLTSRLSLRVESEAKGRTIQRSNPTITRKKAQDTKGKGRNRKQRRETKK